MGIFAPAVAGLIGTLLMTVVMGRASLIKLPETQMIRAIGAFVTKDAKTALTPGILIHTAGGVFFAYVYYFVLSTVPEQFNTPLAIAIVCTFMAMAQGLMVNLLLMIAIAPAHPVEEFQKLQPSDMAAHEIGHVIYGLAVGFTLGYFG